MSRLKQLPSVSVGVTIQLTEPEIRALDALVGYGADAFLKVFYAHMGVAYLKPHEHGLRSLFDVIRSDLSPILARANAAKKAFALQSPVIYGRKEHSEMLERLVVARQQAGSA